MMDHIKNGDRIAVLNKMYAQGFFDFNVKNSWVINIIIDEDNHDILPWFKEKDWIPTNNV